jgi:hypothetical protein
LMPVHAFDLLILAVESFIQINQVNCIVLERQGIICAINECCGIIVAADGGLKLSLFLQVMRATNVSLNVMVVRPIKERRVRWTMYGNLLKWFVVYRAFMLKYEITQPGSNGDDEMIVEEANLRWILNVDEIKMSLDGSNTRAGGRPAVTFFRPTPPNALCLLGKVITELHRHLWKQHCWRVRSTVQADPNDCAGG